ncbi:MAG: PAS domain-containing protein [Planctomycetota bacterium]|jgi:signal transduction histidine kinase|nr:PAS domain-containing protein [Planctomycetota bacterium]
MTTVTNGDAPEQAPLPPDLRELGEIIRAYSAAAAELQQSHQLLQAQVKELSGELHRKNLELSETVTQVSSLKNYLASIIESSADGIVAIDLDRRVMAWNPAANLLRDIEPALPENPEGVFILDAMPGKCRDLALMLMRSLSEEIEIAGVEKRFPDAGGHTRSLSVSASPVRSVSDGGVNTIGAVQTFSDLTRLRELEDRVNRQDRLAALGEMAAGVAHEIRNPLGGIELYASSLGRRFAAGSPEAATCRKIIAAASSLNRIVTDMLTFTRGRAPRLRPSRIMQVVSPALDMAARELQERGIESRVEVEEPERQFLLDPEQLSQAALNVVLNAAQAMAEKGNLTVSAGTKVRDGREILVLAFADDGPGIPDDAKDKIFNPFFTLRRDGTGLGLAIVHKIVGDHGGEVTVSDNRPRGAVVAFELPVG